MPGADDSVFVEDDIAAQPIVLEALVAARAVPGALDGVLRYAVFGPAPNPGHAVPSGIQEAHPRPRREDEHQVGWYRLVVFVSIDDLEGLGEGQEMCTWIGRGDPAHALQVFAAEDIQLGLMVGARLVGN